MYLVNRWRVGRPIFGLIDEVAERTGFYPVYPKDTPRHEPVKAAAPASADSKVAPIEPVKVIPATSPIAAAK
jgi:hypothetical protein